MREVVLGNRPVLLEAKCMIGEGGEAEVYRIDSGTALKVFKDSKHPDFSSSQELKRAADLRLKEHQKKLPSFPGSMPPSIVAPTQLAYHATKSMIVGYSMPCIDGADVLSQLADRQYRLTRTSGNDVISLFQAMHQTLSTLYERSVVVGDFNDLNVLIKDKLPYFIDADSYQFAHFPCLLFTERFIDPQLWNGGREVTLDNRHNQASDWYAFAALLMQSLLCVGPYGGIHSPKQGRPLSLAERMWRRVTVFSPEVRYPKPALSLETLPDTLLHELESIFVHDKRAQFEPALLRDMQFRRCSACGLEYARALCPVCSKGPGGVRKELITIRGEVCASQLYDSRGGTLVSFAVSAQRPLWLYRRNGEFSREGDVPVEAPPQVEAALLLEPDTVFLSRGFVRKTGSVPTTLRVDNSTLGLLAASNGSSIFFVQNGVLYQDRSFAPRRIGEIIPNQAWFNAGSAFGFGFYRAGSMTVSFLFRAQSGGLLDSLKLPIPTGHLLSNTAVFGDSCVWWRVCYQSHGVLKYRLLCISEAGEVLGVHDSVEGDGSWLSLSGGMVAIQDKLLIGSDDGIGRVELHGGTITLTRRYPDTEPFVSRNSVLALAPSGIYAASDQGILQLTLR